MVDQSREPAVVASEHYDEERCVTHYLMMKGPTGGWGQGFGQLVLDEKSLAAWKAELCALFRVDKIEDVVGRQCFVLRSWPSWGERIEGLEVDGRRFTITGFCRKHWPDKTKSRLECREIELRDDIDRHAMRIRECVQRLVNVRDGYVDWDVPSESPSQESK